MKHFWRENITRLIKLGLALKGLLLLFNRIERISNPKPIIQEAEVSHKLETIYDVGTETFKVLDNANVSFTMRPRKFCQDNVIMIMSAPGNFKERNKYRARYRDYNVTSVFLLGTTEDEDISAELREEAVGHGDLLQISVKDDYWALAYKTLAGFIWVNRFCGYARFIIKVDDNSVFDLETLEKILTSKYGADDPVPDILECPSVVRNARPNRVTRKDSMSSKWSISEDENSRRVNPESCIGWIYVTTPRVGLALTEVAVTHYEELKKMVRLDDLFITGFVREYLPWIQLRNNSNYGFKI